MYKVLKAFKEQDANGNGDKTDEIPLGAMDNWSAVYLNKQMMAMFGMYALGRTKEGTNYNFYVDDNGKVGMYETTENYKAYLTYMQKLYTEGLMDSEFYTMTDAQFTDRVEIVATIPQSNCETFENRVREAFNAGVVPEPLGQVARPVPE